MAYFLIHCLEDGDVFVKQYEREDLLCALRDEDYDPIEFMDKLDESDSQYWNKSLIIKGKIVVPKSKKIVEQYDI